MNARERTPGSAPAERAAPVIALLYAALTFAWYCVWFARMGERSGDPAIFENCLWNAAHGHGLRTALEGSFPHLAVHFSPILWIFVPLYALLPSLHVMHVVLSISIAAAGLVLYRMAREGGVESRAALFLMIAFLFHPNVALQTFMEFHEQALVFLPAFLMLRSHARRSFGATLLSAVVLLSIREDNVMVLAAMTLYSALTSRERRLTLSLAVLTLAWFGLWQGVGMHALGGGRIPGVFGTTYGQWGRTPIDALRAIFWHPLAVARHLATAAPLQYLAQLAGPFVFVFPFLNPVLLLALPHLALILLSDPASRMYEIRLHYTAMPVIALFAASIATLARASARAQAVPSPSRRRSAATVMAGLLALTSIGLAPLWVRRAIRRLNPFVPEIRAMLASIPDTASVAAPRYLANRLAQRRGLDIAEDYRNLTTEYVIVETREKQYFEGPSLHQFQSPALDERVRAQGYQRTYERDGFTVYRRDSRLQSLPARLNR